MESNEEVRARVRKGAALLDDKYPGWRCTVAGTKPLTGAQMKEAFGVVGECGCVLARTTGDYYKAVRLLLPDRPNADYEYGFIINTSTVPDWDDDSIDRDFEQLAAAWREELGLLDA